MASAAESSRTASRSRSSSRSAPSGSGFAPWRRLSSSAPGRPVHSRACTRKSPIGMQRGHVEEVVDVGAALLVLAAAVEVGEQFLRAERGRLDCQQRQVVADRRRFHLAVPALQLLAPGLALEHGRARLQPRSDLGLALCELVPHLARRMADSLLRGGDRPGAVVEETVDEGQVQVLEQRPVAPQALAEAGDHLLREELCVEARRGPCEVRRVQEPDTWPRRRERSVQRRRSWSSSSSMLAGFRRSSSVRTRTAQAAAFPASAPSSPHWSRIACQAGALTSR